jgi:hypothetical protein
MAWPSVKTTITPSHYACIAITLCSLFPPEVAESITRLTKTCDEAQNLLDHGVLYVHTYMLNTLKNVSLSPFSSMRLSEVCPSQKTMDTKRCITSHIWRVGKASNNPHIATWGAWIPDNRTVSRRMIDSIKEEYPWKRKVCEGSINSYLPSSGSDKSRLLEDLLHIYSVKSKRDYKKIAKKEKKKRNKMLKHQTPKKKIKFSKNQPRYNNSHIK